MSGNEKAPIIVKKVVKGGGDGHHGGAWKVAYADFVTAMMAFFLLMWLLNATTEKQRKGIADYFDPSIPLARISAGGNNVLDGDSVVARQRRSGSKPPQAEDVGPETVLIDRTLPDPSPHARGGRATSGSAPHDPAGADAGAGAYEAAYRAEEARLEQLAEEVRAAVSAAGGGFDAHFLVRMTPEGLVIEIADTGQAPLFASGSAAPAPKLAELMAVIVPVLGLTTNPIAIVGHTDASPFTGAGSDNWVLSTERANAARRLMLAAGLDEARLARVSGRAAREPLSEDPHAPENRRIALTLLRHVPR
ncbi:flagellar motor protein MotB [Paralimibaculum aggregatum]|uniref:Flagellar motor protein MotB n=1 Tax=Paralimibaculum aggregatum TaxID=3036245 RepID=A0ABQ6LPU4_9RHOB|nr:flagellar motor protein MotB [Limibaculum sp. NKW23]GMG83857.1 flagellar motor protein MotB [Limibaculum sp. NKW23]